MTRYSDNPPENQYPSRDEDEIVQSHMKNSGAEQKNMIAPDRSIADEGREPTRDRSKEVADFIISISVKLLLEIREARVQYIHQRVLAGTYTVDPRQVAASILRSSFSTQ